MEMFLVGGELLFWGQDSMSVSCAVVVDCLQEQPGHLEERDWEEIQMREKFSFFLTCTFMYRIPPKTCGSYFHSDNV